MNDIIKLTDEYASNLTCLFLNLNKSLKSYHDLFQTMFQNCIVTTDITIPNGCIPESIDIVFIKIDNSLDSSQFEKIKTFIKCLRKDKELIPIYLIEDNILNIKTMEITNKCSCIDGLLPTPFSHNDVYRFLYRILKRITRDKELFAYILTLEEELFIPKTSPIEVKKKEIKSSTKDKVREKDIRFSSTEKISALEFMDSLDDTIIDKVESLNDELESLIALLYHIDASTPQESLNAIPKANIVIQDIYILVDAIGAFQVTARAFGSLNDFLSSLTLVELSDIDKKHMFIVMLLSIIEDLEKWLEVIFINHTTDDIHYLDASFSSNIIELENIFLAEDDDGDDDDLEFF